MSVYQDLLAIKERFEVFLGKLTERANELEQDALSMAQEAYDEDQDPYKRSYLNFKSGIEGQFNNLRNKVNDVFDKQVFSLREAIDTNDSDWGKSTNLYHEIYEIKNNFTDLMYTKSENIFNSVKEISAETKLNEVLAEYEEIKNSFCCSQCGGNIEIKQMYFVSTYIECEHCQTQNTFTPSTQMKMVHFLAKEVGEERHQDLRQLNEENKEESIFFDNYWSYFQYRAFVWLETAKIVPVLKEENLEVFYRELHDIIQYQDRYGFFENANNYERLLEMLDFENTDKPLSKEDKEQLNELAIFFIEKIGHFDKYQSTYKYTLEKLKN